MTEQEFKKLKVGDKIKYKYGDEIVLEKITSLNYDRIFSSPIDSNTIGNSQSKEFTSDNWILVEQRLPIVGEMVKCEDEDGLYIGKVVEIIDDLNISIDMYSCNEGFYNSAGFEHHNDSYWDGWTFNVNELKCIFDECEGIKHYGHRRSNFNIPEYKAGQYVLIEDNGEGANSAPKGTLSVAKITNPNGGYGVWTIRIDFISSDHEYPHWLNFFANPKEIIKVYDNLDDCPVYTYKNPEYYETNKPEPGKLYFSNTPAKPKAFWFNEAYETLYTPGTSATCQIASSRRLGMSKMQEEADRFHQRITERALMGSSAPFKVNTISEDGMSMTGKFTYGMTLSNKLNNKSKIKTMCENITKFAQNLTLSANEKLYRKVGLQDDNGTWSDEAKEIILNKEATGRNFKDCREMTIKYNDRGYGAFELDNLFESHSEYLLSIAKDYAKSLNKNK